MHRMTKESAVYSSCVFTLTCGYTTVYCIVQNIPPEHIAGCRSPVRATLCRFSLPWTELGEMDIRCCEEAGDDEGEEAFVVLDRGQPSVLGAERGRELVVQ